MEELKDRGENIPSSCLRELPESASRVSEGIDRRRPVGKRTRYAQLASTREGRKKGETNGSERNRRDDREHHERELGRNVEHRSD